jgi:hypothetical protein
VTLSASYVFANRDHDPVIVIGQRLAGNRIGNARYEAADSALALGFPQVNDRLEKPGCLVVDLGSPSVGSRFRTRITYSNAVILECLLETLINGPEVEVLWKRS